jgi:hypothetical protein
VVRTGGTQRFAATAHLGDGRTIGAIVTYQMTGGSISSAGIYTAGQTAGTFRVIATQSGGTLADTAVVTVTAPPPTASPTPPPPPPTSGSGKIFFTADAESGDMSAWSLPWGVVAEPGDPLPAAVTTRAKTGSWSYKYEVKVTGRIRSSRTMSGAPQVSMGSPNGRYRSGYYSQWVYIDAGYDGAGESGVWNLLMGWMTGASGHPHPIGHIGLEKRGGILQLYYRASNAALGNCYTSPTIPGYTNLGSNGYYYKTASSPNGITPFPRQQWVHISTYFKMAATNGQVQVWQDGVMIMDLSAPTLDTFGGHGGPGTIAPCQNPGGDMMLQFGDYGGTGSTLPERMYMDDFKVTDYRVVP